MIVVYRTLVAFTIASGELLFVVLFILHRLFVPKRNFSYRTIEKAKVNVGLTAYNDEICIGDAVREFKNCPLVNRVIVVENNSRNSVIALKRKSTNAPPSKPPY